MPHSIVTTAEQLQEQFDYLHQLSRNKPLLNWSEREEQLNNLEKMLSRCKNQLATAISQDFGHRSASETQFVELLPSFMALSHTKKNGKSWMQERRVPIAPLYRPAHNEIRPQPLGVVGIMVPWNYPLFLAIGPLIDVLAAGNRIMIKMSEAAPHFATAFAHAVNEYFSEDMVSVVLGDIEMSQAFCRLPFDHLLYTGSTEVGKKIMAAAAPNLTPVTLELGGKSPVVVLDDVNLENAVNRVMMGKTLNAGQTCIAPDYVLIHRKYHQQFIELAKKWMREHYPNIASNEDYTHIINNEQFERIQSYFDELDDSCVHELTSVPANTESRLMPPVIVQEPPLDSRLMSEELFAPVLPLIHYDHLIDAVSFVNKRPRPLTLYIFGNSSADIDYVCANTVSGSVGVNEVIIHVVQHDLPFGGVGASGVGAYHGKIGFERFSHMKPVFVQSKINTMNLLLPPYGKLFHKAIGIFIK